MNPYQETFLILVLLSTLLLLIFFFALSRAGRQAITNPFPPHIAGSLTYDDDFWNKIAEKELLEEWEAEQKRKNSPLT